MKKPCPGYRDQLNLLFHDETARTRARVRRVADADALQYNSAIWPPWILSSTPEHPMVTRFYHLTLENLSEKDPARDLHTYLPLLYGRSKHASALRLSAQAMSCASSAMAGQKSQKLARRLYMEAIRATNKAIMDPVEAQDDATLYAVLLLSGYETKMIHQNVPSAWGTHVDGATALLKLRGHANSALPLSRSLFFFVSKNMVLSSMQTLRPIDDQFITLHKLMLVGQSPEEQLLSLAMGIPDLQWTAQQLFSEPSCTTRRTECLFESARELDTKLRDWATCCSTIWPYATSTNIGVTSAPEYIPFHIHRYPDFYTARVWNFYRTSRLILQSIIRWSVDKLPERLEELDDTSIELVNDICASVSFLLGHDSSGFQEFSYQHTRSNRSTSPSTGRFSLIWPLHVASSDKSIPLEQRIWMQTRLRRVAEQGEALAFIAGLHESRILCGSGGEHGGDSIRFDCV